MDDNTLILMLWGSLALGALGLLGFLWGLKSGQFDDEKRFRHGLLFDGEDELNDAAQREEKKKQAINQSAHQKQQTEES